MPHLRPVLRIHGCHCGALLCKYGRDFICYLFFSLTFLTDIGAAYGTAKSGVGISSMGVMNPQLVMRNIIPVVMAGVLGIYGLIVAVIIQGSSEMRFSLLNYCKLHFLLFCSCYAGL